MRRTPMFHETQIPTTIIDLGDVVDWVYKNSAWKQEHELHVHTKKGGNTCRNVAKPRQIFSSP